MISNEEFNKVFKAYMKIVGRNEDDETLSFYYRQLQYANLADLKRAVLYFCSKLKFATVAEIMDECDLYKPLSKREQKELEERFKNIPKPLSDEIPAYEKFHGEWVFQCISYCKAIDDAKKDFDKQAQEKLIKNGWEIKRIISEDTGVEENPVNKQKHNIFIRNYLAYRD